VLRELSLRPETHLLLAVEDAIAGQMGNAEDAFAAILR
jgi:hypothetical protein